MSQKIPGGRQRASSEGDILDGDEENDVLESNQPLNESHRQVSRSIQLTGDTHLQTFDDEDRRSDRSIGPCERKKKSRKLSFKSVKNLMGRVMRNASSSSSVKDQDLNSRATWTPTMKRKNDAVVDKKTAHNEWRSEREVPGSTSRPLITDPYYLVPRYRWEKIPGVVGLHNHGNTCFMNAVLQCLSNTDSFTEYFVTDMHTRILRNNRNGSKKGLGRGEVTEQIGMLLKSLWSNKYSSEVSSSLKTVVGKCNSQYKGSSQHDAQEFLLWLLDRIHEDLASSSKKKVKPLKNAHLAGDEELAAEALAASSSSFVSELFQALHRSSLTCPHCGRHSNTFDPYLCVSLPLPQRCPRPVLVTLVVTGERSRAVRIGFRLNAYDMVRDLRGTLSSNTGIPDDQLILCQVAEDGERTVYSDDQPLSDIPDSESVFALETFPPEPPSSQESYVQLFIVHVEREHSPSRSRWFCGPAIVRVPREVSCRQLQREVLGSLGDAVKEGARSEINRLNLLFRLRVVDGTSERVYLPNNVEMPLFTEAIDRALSLSEGGLAGPPNIMLVAEWESQAKKVVIEDDMIHIEEHRSVQEVKVLPDSQLSVSLEECLHLYTQEETLSGGDAWLCPHCRHQQQGASKTLGLWSLPDVLVLHLKRFKQIGLRRNKLNTLVEFPVNGLDMSPHLVPREHRESSPSSSGPSSNGTTANRVSNGTGGQPSGPGSQSRDDVIYDLFAVANHYGNMMGGHYTAYCRSPVNGKWNEFDDTRVRVLPETNVATKAAYLLFYQRRSLTKFCNQNLHTGTHWVFKISPPKPASPPNTTSSPSSALPPSQPVSRSHSPQRPLRAPLTPQPPRRHNLVAQVVEYYDESQLEDSRGRLAESPDRSDRPALRKQSSEPSYLPQKNVDVPNQPYRSSEPTYKSLQSAESSVKHQQSNGRPEKPVSVAAVLPQNPNALTSPGTSDPPKSVQGSESNAASTNSGLQGSVPLTSKPSRLGTYVSPTVTPNPMTSDLERTMRPASEGKGYEVERAPRPVLDSEMENVRDRLDRLGRQDSASESKGGKTLALQADEVDSSDGRTGHVESRIRQFENRIDATDEQNRKFERLKDQYRRSYRPERPPKHVDDFGGASSRRSDKLASGVEDYSISGRRPEAFVDPRVAQLEDSVEQYYRVVDAGDSRGMPRHLGQERTDAWRNSDPRESYWLSREGGHGNELGSKNQFQDGRDSDSGLREREGHERYVDLSWNENGEREGDRRRRPINTMDTNLRFFDQQLQQPYRVQLPPPKDPGARSADVRNAKYATIARGNRSDAFSERRGSGGGGIGHDGGSIGMPRSVTDYSLHMQTSSRPSRNDQPRMSERHFYQPGPASDQRDSVSISSTHSRSRLQEPRDGQAGRSYPQPSYYDRPEVSNYRGFSRYPRAFLSRTYSQSQPPRKLEVAAPVLKESSV